MERDRGVELPRGRRLAARGVPLVMGILNVTPDSFSDGGRHFDRGRAVDAALRMEESGASIIDVGGESTRPGAMPVEEAEERDRVVPVIEAIRQRSDVILSVDTMKASVAEAAIEAGADIVNDVTALRGDAAMPGVVRDRGVALILMHMQGEPRTMQNDPRYDDVVDDVHAELEAAVTGAESHGIARERIMVDPGIGFGKTFDHNLQLLANAAVFASIAPLVIGASRKAFIGHLTGRIAYERQAGSLAAVAAAALASAMIVRVHDVAETADFLKVMGPILEARR